MADTKYNATNVPQYPIRHAGRLFVVAAAVSTLERPTASSVAALTGLSKGNMDKTVLIDIPSHLGIKTIKNGAVYQITDWGWLVYKPNVERCLMVVINADELIK